MILLGVLVVLLGRLVHGAQVSERGHVEGVARGVLSDGVIHCRLEAGFVDDEIGLGHLGRLRDIDPRSWLRPGSGQQIDSAPVPSATRSVSQASG